MYVVRRSKHYKDRAPFDAELVLLADEAQHISHCAPYCNPIEIQQPESTYAAKFFGISDIGSKPS
jgi:hypothetical protein